MHALGCSNRAIVVGRVGLAVHTTTPSQLKVGGVMEGYNVRRVRGNVTREGGDARGG